MKRERLGDRTMGWKGNFQLDVLDRWFVVSNLNLLVAVLGRRYDHDRRVKKLIVFGFLVSLTLDHAIGDDAHNPDHPQKNTNTASDDESDGTALPGPECHESVVDASQERSVVVLETMMVAMGPHLYLTRGTSFNRSANERHGHDTDETAMDLLLTIGGVHWVRLDKREAKCLPENVGDSNRFRPHSTTTAVRTVEFRVMASIIDLGRRQGAWSDLSNFFGIGGSISQTHVGRHSCDYNTYRTGADMLSNTSASNKQRQNGNLHM